MRRSHALWFSCAAALGAIAISPEMGCGGNSTGGGGMGGTGGGSTASTSKSSTASTTSTSGTGGQAQGGGGSGGGGPPVCGNGKVEGTEECDDGNLTSGDGCENDCYFTCIAGVQDRDHCDDGDACNGKETCGADHKCAQGTPLADGAACGNPGSFCVSLNCVPASCGDGVLESPEECDDGNAASGDGCEPTCKFSCVSTDPLRNCSNPDICAGNGTCNDNTHVCGAATPLPDGTACGGKHCEGGVCTLVTCGNGVVEAGEQCDPPDGITCSPTCQTIVSPKCGNGVIDKGEQCDDGNLLNLDGCDSNCKYEAVYRMSSVSIQGTAAPAFCTPTTNRLGTQSMTGTALSQLNPPLQQGIDQGVTNIMAQFLGLDDLTGVADSNGLSMGVENAYLDPAKGTWPNNNPIDWWFRVDHTTVDTLGLPTGVLGNAKLAARVFTAGPSDVDLSLIIGVPAILHMRDAHVVARLDGSPAPNVPAPPPAMLKTGLTVFQDMTASGTGQGLCGNITVESLSQIPAPQTLTTGGATQCGMCAGSQTYTYCGNNMPVGANCNSLLDVLVGGCKVINCIVTAINPQEPDVPAMMGGTVTALTLDPTTHKVPGNLVSGNQDAYSAYLKFNAKRAHLTGETCSVTADCQSGKTCTNGACK